MAQAASSRWLLAPPVLVRRVRQTEAGQPDAGSQTSPGLAGRGDGFPPDHHAGPKPDIRIWTGP